MEHSKPAEISKHKILEDRTDNKFLLMKNYLKEQFYKDYVKIIGDLTKASPYDYQDLVLNYIKVGLSGHKFNIDGYELNTQSDGTNSHRFIELFLSLIISLTRREFITPIVYIDEPELGLHPKTK